MVKLTVCSLRRERPFFDVTKSNQRNGSPFWRKCLFSYQMRRFIPLSCLRIKCDAVNPGSLQMICLPTPLHGHKLPIAQITEPNMHLKLVNQRVRQCCNIMVDYRFFCRFGKRNPDGFRRKFHGHARSNASRYNKWPRDRRSLSPTGHSRAAE